MGIDHTTTSSDDPSENVEPTSAPDRPPPPPPDKPGSEGYPSRADSRAGAAAATRTEQLTVTETQDQKDGGTDTTAEPSNAKSAVSADRDTKPESANEPTADAQPATAAAKDPEDVRSRAGAGVERAAERPAGLATGTAETRDESRPADQGSVLNSRDGEDTARSMPSTEVADRPGNDGSHPEASIKGGPVKTGTDADISADTSLRPMTETREGQESAPAAERSPSGSEAARVSHDAAGARLGTTRDERLDQSGGTVDAPTPMVDHAEPVAGENGRVGTDRAAAGDQPEATKSDDDTSSSREAPSSLQERSAESASATGESRETQEPEKRGTQLPDIPEKDDARTAESNGESMGKPARTEDAPPAIVAQRPLGERLMVEGEPLREYLDPVGAAAWSKEIGDDVPDPTDRLGDRIADTSNDKRSRRERMRREGWRRSEDIVDVTQKRLGDAETIFRPPTGHVEVNTSPEAIPTPPGTIGFADLVTTLVAAGMVAGELYRFGRNKLTMKKERDRGSDR